MTEYRCLRCEKPCGAITAEDAVRLLGVCLVYRHGTDLVSDCCGGSLERTGFCRDGGDLVEIEECWRREAALGYLERTGAWARAHERPVMSRVSA
jgi:hypothetical protein